jgi:diguanylate cyclase (GGDEF)-like protein
MIPVTSSSRLECPLDPRPCAGVRNGTTLVAVPGVPRETNYPAPTTLEEALVRLAEAEDTLQAIATGEVDAVVVADDVSRRVFALTTADRTYRMFGENMREGAATVSADGLVVYANQRLAELLLRPRELIIGVPLTMFVAARLPLPDTGTHGAADLGMTVEAELIDGNRSLVPVLVGISRLDVDCDPLICLTFTDLSDKQAQDREIARLSRAQAERMTELQEAQAALTQQATHDALTGLANRSVLVERIERALSSSADSGRCTAVFFVDLDRFKLVNDTRGHAAGDIVLRRVAAQLVSLLRPTDTVARIGGDEFVVLAPDIVSSAHALQLAARLAAELCRRPSRAEEREHIAASIGIAFSVGGATNAEALLRDADTAMYEAKSRGGARAVV